MMQRNWLGPFSRPRGFLPCSFQYCFRDQQIYDLTFDNFIFIFVDKLKPAKATDFLHIDPSLKSRFWKGRYVGPQMRVPW